MDPITFLALVGLVSLGGATVAGLLYLLIGLLFYVGLVFGVAAVVLYGILSDTVYNRRVVAGLCEYRLPWYLRWSGWTIASPASSEVVGRYPGMWYDRRGNRIIGIQRRF